MNSKESTFDEITIEQISVAPSLIELISFVRGKSKDKIRRVLRYNVMTVSQMCFLTGLGAGSISNLARPLVKEGKLVWRLRPVYPFQHEDKGVMFILVDETCLELIKDIMERTR